MPRLTIDEALPRLYNIVFVFIMPLFQNKYRIKSTRLPKWDYGFVQLHEYVIMPNHVHGILEICKRRDEALPRLLINLRSLFVNNTTKFKVVAV